MAQKFVKRTRGGRRQEELPNLADLEEINIHGISLIRQPIDENTLIALFFQVLAIKGWELPTFGLSQSSIYDGYFTFPNELTRIRSTNDLHRLEFKVKVSDLIDEFENYEPDGKEYTETNLAIVWDPEIPQERNHWQITGISPALERRLVDAGNQIPIQSVLINTSVPGFEGIPIIVMKDMIQELMDS